MASEVDVCNRAIQKVGGRPITSRTEDVEAARACNRCFEELRDAELRMRHWNFAIKRTSLAASTTTPAYGYDNQFPLPADCLKLVEVDGYKGITEVIGSYGVNDPDYRVESNHILVNDDGPINIRYVARIADVNSWDVIFQELLASRIAIEICERMSESGSKRDLLNAEYRECLKRAVRSDCLETPGEPLHEDDWLLARV